MAERRHAGGFTLTELLTVLAVVGILVAFALPTYQASVNKSRRAECRAALVLAAQNEERYFTNNNGYDSLVTIGGPTFSGNVQGSSACLLTAYAGSLSAGLGTTPTALSTANANVPSPNFVIEAVPQNWTDTQCSAASYALDSTGNFQPLNSSNAALSPVPANCF